MQDLSKWGRRPKDRKKRNPDKIVDSSDSDVDAYQMKHWDAVIWMGDMNYRI